MFVENQPNRMKRTVIRSKKWSLFFFAFYGWMSQMDTRKTINWCAQYGQRPDLFWKSNVKMRTKRFPDLICFIVSKFVEYLFSSCEIRANSFGINQPNYYQNILVWTKLMSRNAWTSSAWEFDWTMTHVERC